MFFTLLRYDCSIVALHITLSAQRHAQTMAADICIAVGRRLKALRLDRGWTQQILADHAQLTREHISAIEGGRSEPGLRALVRIANALDIRVRELIDP